MNYSFRKVVASNPLLYSVYVNTLRNRKGSKVKLPSSNDDLYLDGYPRSGNTYFKNLISNLYPNLNFASHLHVSASIKIALKKELPTFILIRKPEDTIISWVCRKVFLNNAKISQNFVDEKITSYSNYYEFVLKKESEVMVLDFNSIINDQFKFMETLARSLKLELYTKEDFDKAIIQHYESMKLKEENKNDGASSLPNKTKQEFKEKNGWMVKNSNRFRRADELYKKLTT